MKIGQLLLCLAVFGIALFLLFEWPSKDRPSNEESLTQLYKALSARLVKKMEWQGSEIRVENRDGKKYYVRAFDAESPAGKDLVQAALKSDADLRVLGAPLSMTFLSILSVIGFPLMIIALIYFLLIRPMQLARR